MIQRLRQLFGSGGAKVGGPVVPAGNAPLIIGPWLGEVGPELQYWIPWLTKLQQRGTLGGRRLIVVSRGGAELWYRHLTNEYVDAYDVVDHAALRQIRTERPTEKQFTWTNGERALIKQAAATVGVTQYETLHPEMLWKNILPYFQERQPLNWLLDQLAFQQIRETALAEAKVQLTLPQLPPDYIVARLYVSDLFPASPANQQFVKTMFERLAAHHPVVVLTNQQQLDDHAVFPLPSLPNVYPILIDKDIRKNLALQTVLMAGGQAFIGTYGGLTVLPGFLGRPCFGFIGADLASQQALHFRHEAVTQYLYQTSAHQPYVVQTVQAWQQLQNLVV